MTPAEVAALRERLTNTPQYYDPFGTINTVRAADLRAALALLDAQAAEIARLEGERERARADAIEEAAQCLEWMRRGVAAHHIPVLNAAAERVRALLTPVPAAEVAG